MDDKITSKLKELLPYIIITGAIFLIFPLFMSKDTGVSTYIIQIGVFPLTALGCGIFYKLKKKRNDLWLCAVAPLFYALSALLYGMWRASWYTVIIYIAAYFLCGYLGQMLADILPFSKKRGSDQEAKQKPFKKPSLRARRVNVEESAAVDESFKAEDPEADDSLNASTTEDDIEAILNSIHNRKS